jgi:predicted aminopeptidase
MRFATAFLLVAATFGAASAQGTAKNSDEVLRQRLLLQERFNKGYDVQIENAGNSKWIASRCKNEARKKYSAMHPIKRRTYIKDCVARAGR